MAKTRKNSDYKKTKIEKTNIKKSMKQYQMQKSSRAIVRIFVICVLGSLILCVGSGQINMVFYWAFLKIFIVWLGIPFIAAYLFKAWKGNPNSKIIMYTIVSYYFSLGVSSIFNDYVHDFGFSTSLLAVCTLWSFVYSNTD